MLYNRLINVMHTEKTHIHKQRNSEQKGPISLNISYRRKTVDDINVKNKELQKILSKVKSVVPDTKAIRRHKDKYDEFMTLA